MNKVILKGRLTADPELRQTQSGVVSCRFTVAVERKIADKATGQKQSDFINCQAWRQTADAVNKYFRKGQLILLEGTLRTGSYQDRIHNDVTHYTTDVLVESVEFCAPKSGNGQASAPAPQSAPAQGRPQTSQYQTQPQAYGGFEEIFGDDAPF